MTSPEGLEAIRHVIGPIAKAYPTLTPEEQAAVNQIFTNTESTKKALKSLARGSDDLPKPKEAHSPAQKTIGDRVNVLSDNFMAAIAKLTIEEKEALKSALSSPESARKALIRLAANQKAN